MEVADEDAKGVARNLQQFSSQRGMLGAQLLADDHETAGAVPAQQLQRKFNDCIVLVQSAPLGDARCFAFQPECQSGDDDVAQPACTLYVGREVKTKIPVKMAAASAINEQGEDICPRKWNHEFVHMSVVEKDKQNTPSFSAEVMTGLAPWRRERMIFILYGASGLRI